MDECEEIKGVLLDILQVGLMRIRAFGNSGLAEACSAEADHLHNIPVLIQSPRREELLYYYDIEGPAFLSVTTSNTEQFTVLWERLGKLVKP
jgi:hypothetical protein